MIKITFNDLEDYGGLVTNYCRHLVKENKVDLDQIIEVYRGDMRCLIVNDIRKAAKIEPSDDGFRKYKPEKNLKAPIKVAKAPYSDLNAKQV